MKVVALISGGKDSTFNMMQCIAAGHNIVALANLVPHNKSEMDSYMYQSVGHEAIDLIAQAIDLPIYKKETKGISTKIGKIYQPSENDEVEDLYDLLIDIKRKVEYDGVSVGAILSDYQRVRIENVCLRLQVTPLVYLWQRNQLELLDEMIKCEVDAILIKVASLGLEPKKHLGRSLNLMQPHLIAMHEKYGLNVCGEGGEYESLTLDCPLFKSRIVIIDSEIVMHQNDPIAPVGYLKLNTVTLELKLPILDLASRLNGLPLKDSYGYVLNDSNEDIFLDFEPPEPVSAVEGQEENKLNLTFIKQHKTFGYNKNNWLFIGGIQGKSKDAQEALQETLNKLQCRYLARKSTQFRKCVFNNIIHK